MAALPRAVKHPQLIRSGQEGIWSRDALDVPPVLCSGRQKACAKHIQEMWLVIHCLLSVFDLHSQSLEIANATIAM